MLKGWSQYFSLGYCGYAKRDIMYYTLSPSINLLKERSASP